MFVTCIELFPQVDIMCKCAQRDNSIKFNVILSNGKFSKELEGETNKLLPLGPASTNFYQPSQLYYKISMTNLLAVDRL